MRANRAINLCGGRHDARKNASRASTAALAIFFVAQLTGSAVGDDALEARRAQIAGLQPAEQQELLRRQERFLALPMTEQERLRSLQAAIDSDEHAERLHQVLVRYHEWLKTLTPGQRAKLADLPPEERVAEIKRIQQRQQAARERTQRVELLSGGDMREILRWTGDFVWSHRQDLIADMSKEQRQRFEKGDQQSQRRALLFRAFERSRREGDSGALAAVEQGDIDRLAAKLSEPARQALANAESLTARRKLLGIWIGTSMHRSEPWSTRRKQDPLVVEELLLFLQNEVPPVDRERLLKLPREEMLKELRGMYFQRGRGERVPGGGPDRPRFDGRSSDRFKGGPRSKGSRSGDASGPAAEGTPDSKVPDAAPSNDKPPGEDNKLGEDDAPSAPKSNVAPPSAPWM